jgi:hypothetical protein
MKQIISIAVITAGIILTGARSQADQRTFSSPDEAVAALKQATQSHDDAAMRDVFGPDFAKLATGDKVVDAKNAQSFAEAVALSCRPATEEDGRVFIEIGTNEWPMPIPLIKQHGKWHFDTEAGREEIVNRHIGKDEIYAIGICREYVKAQQKYASMNAGSIGSYALHFRSTAGKRDGLYWKSGPDEPISPFSDVVAGAESEGYSGVSGSGSKPYHGYFFRILSAQGPDAPGGQKNYVSDGVLGQGFALVAYPEKWDRSGIMTFIVNQEGVVYEHNLGPDTEKIASQMKEYNPGNGWKAVKEPGIFTSVSTGVQ